MSDRVADRFSREKNGAEDRKLTSILRSSEISLLSLLSWVQSRDRSSGRRSKMGGLRSSGSKIENRRREVLRFVAAKIEEEGYLLFGVEDQR